MSSSIACRCESAVQVGPGPLLAASLFCLIAPLQPVLRAAAGWVLRIELSSAA